MAEITHPEYSDKIREWSKYRFVMSSGQRFINTYLQQFPREGKDDFELRTALTYNPSFAKEALLEIRNAIFPRLRDVKRLDGSKTYQTAITGEDGGVDLTGASMQAFIGREVLPDLLAMGRVGVYVDFPNFQGVTMADLNGQRPYLYLYRVEDIRSWTYDDSSNRAEFANVLLTDYILEYETETGLPKGRVTRYRRVWLADGHVKVQFYDVEGSPVDVVGVRNDDSVIDLDIPRIPFVILDLGASLLEDIANYQIALLNLESSDLSYALFSNFPFYIEQFDAKTENPFARPGPEAADRQVTVGPTKGRRYGKELNPPGFIHPSSEPLTASMNKQKQIKEDIRQLTHLAVANIAAQQSADSKAMDQTPLESGLAYIGLELENFERKVADYWSMYERGSQSATVYYPETYAIKSDAERRAEALALVELIRVAPSITAQKEIAKQIAQLVLSRKISAELMNKILEEIDSSPGGTAKIEILVQDVAMGVVDLKTVAKICGYPVEVVEKAAQEHADRAARIQQAQSKNADNTQDPAARGVPTMDPNQLTSAGQEKQNSQQDTTLDNTVQNKTRGPGK
jgi:hypothetical protein